jgi:predicted small secreted protein
MKPSTLKTAAVVTLLTASLGLTSCGNGNSKAGRDVAAPSAEAVSPATQTPSQDSAKKSTRGNIIMAPGEVGTVSSTTNDGKKVDATKFTVNSIAAGTCDQNYAQPPKNGHIVFVNVTIETLPELAETPFKTFSLSAYDFKFVSNNGTTFNGSLSTVASGYGCIDDARTLPSAGIGPGEKVTGIVVLDVPEPAGILIMKSMFGSGFEYTF